MEGGWIGGAHPHARHAGRFATEDCLPVNVVFWSSVQLLLDGDKGWVWVGLLQTCTRGTTEV